MKIDGTNVIISISNVCNSIVYVIQKPIPFPSQQPANIL